MADKNLHDLKIDQLDSPKKTPLKNILTLLALLLIILVISVVITKLILNTDEGSTIENNDSKINLVNDIKLNSDVNKTQLENTIKTPVLSSSISERNLSSILKVPLTSHTPKKDTVNVRSTSTAPKKHTAPTKVHSNSTKTVKVKTATAPKKKTYTHPKKQYSDKVVAKKNTTHTSSKSTNKNASFMGGRHTKMTNSYYIKVGTYRNSSSVISKIKKNNYNYSLVKVENDKTLTRVLIGPFFSRNQANGQLAKVKANILTGAYVTKAK